MNVALTATLLSHFTIIYLSSVVGSAFFLIFINDLLKSLSMLTSCRLFVSCGKSKFFDTVKLDGDVENDIQSPGKWDDKRLVNYQPSKRKVIFSISFRYVFVANSMTNINF